MSEHPIDKSADGFQAEAPLLGVSKTAESAGGLLRDARAKSGLSLEEVAAQTKIAVPVLQALERDDFARLGQPVYVRGYLRKYAKALNASGDSVVAAFDAQESPRQPGAQQMRLAREAVEVRPGSKSLIWILLIVAAAAGGGFYVWQSRQAKLPAAAAPTPTTSAVEPAAPSAPQEVAAVSAMDLPVAASAATAATDSAGGATATPVSGTPDPSASSAADGQPASEASAPDAVTADGAFQRPGSLAGETVVDDATVTLKFRDSSWVRIRDSRDKVLLNGLVQAGKTESMTGVPPYTISLGRAAAVSVEFQGKPVDLAPYTVSGGTALLTLPPVPAAAPVAATTR